MYVLLMALALSTTFSACKKGPKDADIQKAATEALAANPTLAGMTVTVAEGVATITGECMDASSCDACIAAVEGVPGVKEVVNTCTMKPAPDPEPPVVEVVEVSVMQQAVNDALKDNPGVVGTVNDGVLTLTGTIQKSKHRGLMQMLHSMKMFKKIESAELIVK